MSESSTRSARDGKTRPVDTGEDAVPIEEQIKAALLAAFNIEPGMGGPAEPVWETYRPEGVAIVLTNAVLAVVNPWAEDLVEAAAKAIADELVELFASEDPGRDADAPNGSTHADGEL